MRSDEPTRLMNEPLPAVAWLMVRAGGPDRGRRFDLKPRSHNKIGRSASCAIILDNDTVSKEHAKVLHIGNGHYDLLDLGSLNGTTLNGARVNGRASLHDGDVIQIGNVKLIYKDIH